MNSYSIIPGWLFLNKNINAQYIDGDFVIHFAGKKGELKERLFNHFSEISEEKYNLLYY